MNRRLFFDSKDEAIQYIQRNKIQMVDLKFIDLYGQPRHVTLSATACDASVFIDGIGFDGSSVTKFRSTESGDLSIIPDLQVAFLDPFWESPTLSFLCNIVEADRPERRFPSDPRFIAQKAEIYLRTITGGLDVRMSPEAEFFLFDQVSFNNASNLASFSVQSQEVIRDAPLPSGSETVYRLGITDGYHRCPPGDRYYEIRSEICEVLEECGILTKYHHHEVGGASQQEIELGFNGLLRMCDDFFLLKYIVKNVAARHNLVATFMPKPLFGEPGNGMHIHMFLVDQQGNSMFYKDGADYADLSDMGIAFIAGLLDHGRSLLGFTNPSTNSYRRLVPGHEAPTQLYFSSANRCAAIRIPKYARTSTTKRMEFRSPDASCNIHLAAAAILMAALDGLERSLTPQALLDPDSGPRKYIGPVRGRLEDESAEMQQLIEQVPANLEAALGALAADRDYLCKQVSLPGSGCEEPVFSEDLITRWIQLHLNSDVRPISLRPTPYEYQLYFNC